MLTEVLKGGYANEATRIGDSVVKVFSATENTTTSPQRRYQRERFSLQRFQSVYEFVPQLYNVEDATRTITMQYILGFPLHDYIQIISDEERSRIMIRAGQLLHQIHTPVNSNPTYYWTAFIDKTKKEIENAQEILFYEGLKKSQILETIDSLVDKKEIQEIGTTRVHRDFWLNNLVYDGKDIVGLIDWEYGGIGLPIEDLALFRMLVAKKSQDEIDFWRGYERKPSEDTLNGFLLAKSVHYLADTSVSEYINEVKSGQGFYLNLGENIKRLTQ